MPLDLHPLETSSAVDRCEAVLLDALLSGELAVGERLPPERELASQLGLNRATVRSAVARLEARGLVSVRQGSGVTALDWRSSGGPDLLAPLTARAAPGARGALAADVLALRRAVAALVLERLPAVVPPERLAAFAAAIEGMEAEVARGAPLPDIAAADVAVARALVACTGSDALAVCTNPVLSVLLDWPALQAAMFADPASNVLGWRAVAALLAAGGPVDPRLLASVLAERDSATVSRLEVSP